jgi:hypothetical protein
VADLARTISRNAARGHTPRMRVPLNVAGTHEQAQLRARLLAKGWRTAPRPGACAVCGDPYYPPQATKPYPTITPGREYRADCCPGEDRG